MIECDVVKNFAFVHMSKETMAREAIKCLDKTDFNGNVIAVQFARQRPEDMGSKCILIMIIDIHPHQYDVFFCALIASPFYLEYRIFSY